MSLATWIAVGALIVAALALGVALRASLKLRRLGAESPRTAHLALEAPNAARADGPVVVIYNPAKEADYHALRTTLNARAASAGLGEPIWIATTEEDPGPGQAREALGLGASLIIAAGGDGTVRMVAGEVAGTGVPLGLLPIGTGNLLARNLRIPLTDYARMADIALTGRTRRIDVGRLAAPALDEESREEIRATGARAFEGSVPFLVISGIGFDAEVMASANPNLKSTLGWSAYVVSGAQHLRDKKVHATIEAAGGQQIEAEARSIMFANCGELVGGFVLAPHARMDDGWLDLAVMDTKGGLIGWGDLLRRVSLQGYGAADTAAEKLLPEAGSLEIRRFSTLTVATEDYEQVEADGDLLGFAKKVTASIEAGALAVRVG